MGALATRRMNSSMHCLDVLQQIYRIHDDFIGHLDLACTKGCAACCTCNVTLTSLEAALMIRRLNRDMPGRWQLMLSAASELPRFQPKVTINQLADLCIHDEPIPEEQMDPQAGPCPLLKDDMCTVYDVRPFGCRAMVSTTAVCATDNPAEMPELALTVNNVFLQYLEAADSRGVSGNLIDILLYLDNDKDDAMDIRRFVQHKSRRLLANRPMSVLMIPPEHRDPITPWLEKIQAVFRNHQNNHRT